MAARTVAEATAMAMGDPTCTCEVPTPEIENYELTGGCAICGGELDDAALQRYQADIDRRRAADRMILGPGDIRILKRGDE
jgi:hypothetical protein